MPITPSIPDAEIRAAVKRGGSELQAAFDYVLGHTTDKPRVRYVTQARRFVRNWIRRTGPRPAAIPDRAYLGAAREVKAVLVVCECRGENARADDIARRYRLPSDLVRRVRSRRTDPQRAILDIVDRLRACHGRGPLQPNDVLTLCGVIGANWDKQDITTWRSVLETACKYRAKSDAASGTESPATRMTASQSERTAHL